MKIEISEMFLKEAGAIWEKQEITNGLQKWDYAIGAEKKKQHPKGSIASIAQTEYARKTGYGTIRSEQGNIKRGEERFISRRKRMESASDVQKKQLMDYFAMSTQLKNEENQQKERVQKKRIDTKED